MLEQLPALVLGSGTTLLGVWLRGRVRAPVIQAQATRAETETHTDAWRALLAENREFIEAQQTRFDRRERELESRLTQRERELETARNQTAELTSALRTAEGHIDRLEREQERLRGQVEDMARTLAQYRAAAAEHVADDTRTPVEGIAHG